MMMKVIALVLVMAALVQCQRPSYAGFRPIGYPEIVTTSTAAALADRFGEVDATTQRLPIEANGDRDLIDRLSKLPIDKQPFWFINWQALEANRQKPQTFPQKPNTFIDPISPGNAGNFVANQNLGTNTGNFVNPNTNFGNTDSGSFANPNGNLGNTNSGSFVNPTSGTGSNSNFSPSNVNSAVPTSSNTPSVNNRKSASVNSGSLEDRFSGGIAVNRYTETEASNHKAGKPVSAEDEDDY